MKIKRIGFATKLIVLLSILLLLANALLGWVLYVHSKDALSSIIQERMLDISNSAADFLDGDIMGKLQAEDVNTEEYQEQLNILATFQDNIALEYIYGIRKMEDGSFTFTIDPAPVDPGEFGSPIVTTDALVSASNGVAMVDKEAYTDDWGRFYSAYSPIFDSNGNVTGIVGVDFSAEWFDGKLKENTYYVVFGCVISMIVGAMVVFILTSQIRHRFEELVDDVEGMASDLKQLTDEAKRIGKIKIKSSNVDDNNTEEKNADDIDRVKNQISKMHAELKDYLSYVKVQAYKDGMTGVNNKSAYLELVHHIQNDIKEGNADFSIVVFDINGLKKVNDFFGHEEGDRIIISSAQAITEAFGEDNIFRIGGDEFIAVMPEKNESDIEECYVLLDKAIDEINNSESPLSMPLSISRGMAVFTSGDADYKEVFKRADNEMYKNKAEYYEKH